MLYVVSELIEVGSLPRLILMNIAALMVLLDNSKQPIPHSKMGLQSERTE
jgi:hypothetical protein